MTVREMISDLKFKFENVGIDTAVLDAQLIVGKAMSMSRVEILTYPEKIVNEAEICKINEMAHNRIMRMPMQYILGVCEFMGMDFNVNENTLIPRGDTEILVEKAIEIFDKNSYNSVLDIGTGSGAIAVSMAKYTNAKVTAVDISKSALNTAIENANKNNVTVEFVQSNLFENINGKFDVIISNPPYIESDVINTLEPDVKDYEPMLALDGGSDGLIFYRRIVNECDNYLNKKGCILFEIGYNQGNAVSQLLISKGFENVDILKDLAGLDRVVIGYKLN